MSAVTWTSDERRVFRALDELAQLRRASWIDRAISYLFQCGSDQRLRRIERTFRIAVAAMYEQANRPLKASGIAERIGYTCSKLLPRCEDIKGLASVIIRYYSSTLRFLRTHILSQPDFPHAELPSISRLCRNSIDSCQGLRYLGTLSAPDSFAVDSMEHIARDLWSSASKLRWEPPLPFERNLPKDRLTIALDLEDSFRAFTRQTPTLPLITVNGREQALDHRKRHYDYSRFFHLFLAGLNDEYESKLDQIAAALANHAIQGQSPDFDDCRSPALLALGHIFEIAMLDLRPLLGQPLQNRTSPVPCSEDAIHEHPWVMHIQTHWPRTGLKQRRDFIVHNAGSKPLAYISLEGEFSRSTQTSWHAHNVRLSYICFAKGISDEERCSVWSNLSEAIHLQAGQEG